MDGTYDLSVTKHLPNGSVALSNGSRLTAREVDIVALMAAGLRNQEIADRLYLSVHTVEYNATRIFGKLGVRNRTEAGVLAVRLRLLEPAFSPQASDTSVPEAAKRGKAKMLSSWFRPNVRLTRVDRSSIMLNRILSWRGRTALRTRLVLLVVSGLIILQPLCQAQRPSSSRSSETPVTPAPT